MTQGSPRQEIREPMDDPVAMSERQRPQKRAHFENDLPRDLI